MPKDEEPKITEAEVVPSFDPPEDSAVPGKELATQPAAEATPPSLGAPAADKYVAAFEHKDVGMMCATCFLGKMCVEFKDGKPCSLGISADIDGPKDVIAFTKYMLKISAERVMRSYHFELTNGGVISPEVKEAMGQFMELTRMVKELTESGETLKIEARGGPGIISQIFGSMSGVNKK